MTSIQQRVIDVNPLTLVREPLWTRNFILLSISNFLMFVSLQMLLPTFPVYVETIGADSFQVGLAVSLFSAAALIARPFTGILLDTIGRRIIVYTGLGLLVLFSVQYFWITSVLVILVIRVLHGIAWGISTTGMSTTVADIVPKSRRGEGLGYFGLSVTISLAIAPYFGLWVVERFGFTWMFIVSCAMATASLLLIYGIRFTQLPPVQTTARQTEQPNLLSRIFERSALMPALLVFLFTSAYSAVEVYIAMFTEEHGLPTAGPFFIVLAVAMFVVRPFSGKLYDRFGVKWLVLVGILITIGGILLLSVSRSMPVMLTAGAICGAGLSAVMPSLQAWNVDRAPQGRLGAASGTYMSGIDLGFSFGSMFNAVIAGLTTYATMYRLITLYLVLFIVIFVLYTQPRPQKKQQGNLSV